MPPSARPSVRIVRNPIGTRPCGAAVSPNGRSCGPDGGPRGGCPPRSPCGSRGRRSWVPLALLLPPVLSGVELLGFVLGDPSGFAAPGDPNHVMILADVV